MLNKQIFEGKNEEVTQKKIEGITLFIADVLIGFWMIGEGERNDYFQNILFQTLLSHIFYLQPKNA